MTRSNRCPIRDDRGKRSSRRTQAEDRKGETTVPPRVPNAPDRLDD
jgi:hypothetical protein